MVDERCSGAAFSGDDVEHTGWQAGLARDFAEQQRGERRELCGLEHDGAPGRERWGDLPRQHEQREVPRNDLSHDSHALVAGELRLQQLRPPCVVIEVASDERDVDVTRLTDRLAVVHAFQHGEQAGVFLHSARERVQMPRARVTIQPLPRGQHGAGGGHRGIDVVLRAKRDAGELLTRGGIDDVERLSRLGPLAVDEVPEDLLVFAEPVSRLLIRLGRGTILHRFEDLGDCGHGFLCHPEVATRPKDLL